MHIFILKKNSAIHFFSVTFFSNINREENMACYNYVNYPMYEDNTISDNEEKKIIRYTKGDPLYLTQIHRSTYFDRLKE